MKNPFSFLLGLSTAALIAALLGGCVNLDPQLDATRFYTLTSASNARTEIQPAEAVLAAIRVSVAADYLQQPAIAVRRTAQEIVFSDAHRWAERIDLGLTRIVSQGLESRDASLVVEPLARNPGGNHLLLIAIAVTACEGTSDGGAILAADWQIFMGDNSAPFATGRFAGTKQSWDGQDFGQLAALLSRLADELAAEIAPSVGQHVL